jgi:hypothetical protein
VPEVGGTCEGTAWAGTPTTCFESKGACADADPEVPGTTTKALCVATTCEGVAWAGTRAECLESKGTCAGADPDVPGTTTKAACDGAAALAGLFASTAAYQGPGTFSTAAAYVATPTTKAACDGAAVTPGVFSTSAVYVPGNMGWCYTEVLVRAPRALVTPMEEVLIGLGPVGAVCAAAHPLATGPVTYPAIFF